MAQMNWRPAIGIAFGLAVAAVAAVAALRLTRSVPTFVPPANRQLGSSVALDPATAHKLQAVLEEDVNRQRVPGLQAFVRTADGRTWSGASGTTDLERRDPMQVDDILRVGSVTKTFTAVIVLQLVQEGRLSLDDPIAKWFPDFPNADAIRVRQLLDHTSGIPEIIPKVLMKSMIASTYWKPDELVAIIAKDAKDFTPRGIHAYSNTNYILLGMIAEKVSGKPFVQLLHERIIDPLHLKHTYFIPYERAPASLVPGFDRDMSHFPGMLDIGTDNTSWATSAFTSGAMASTAEDLGMFFDRLLAGELLKPATMKEMTTFIDAPNPSIPEENGYGFGLMRLEVKGQELIGHVGWFMGSTAIAMHAPDKCYTIAVTSNLSTPKLAEVLADLEEKIK